MGVGVEMEGRRYGWTLESHDGEPPSKPQPNDLAPSSYTSCRPRLGSPDAEKELKALLEQENVRCTEALAGIQLTRKTLLQGQVRGGGGRDVGPGLRDLLATRP